MGKLALYHGSRKIIDKPIFGGGQNNNDYGSGFYCTEHLELAKEWACNLGVDGYANCYELETDDLKILNLSSDEYTILNWLAILMDNRNVRLSTPVEDRGREYLIRNFLIDYRSYDAIIGYRADDSYFSFARAFVGNGISLRQLEYAMKLGKLGEQFVLISEKAFDAIRYTGYEVAEHSLHYARREERDTAARNEYRRSVGIDDLDGVYIRDIIREEMKSVDERLRRDVSG